KSAGPFHGVKTPISRTTSPPGVLVNGGLSQTLPRQKRSDLVDQLRRRWSAETREFRIKKQASGREDPSSQEDPCTRRSLGSAKVTRPPSWGLGKAVSGIDLACKDEVTV